MSKLTTIELGKEYEDNIGKVKTICFVEKNYVVIKRKGAIPFVVSLKRFAERFKEIEAGGQKSMNRQQAIGAIRSRVVVNAQHIKSLHSIDEVINQLCDEHEERLKEKDIKIEYLQSCIDIRSKYDKEHGED